MGATQAGFDGAMDKVKPYIWDCAKCSKTPIHDMVSLKPRGENKQIKPVATLSFGNFFSLCSKLPQNQNSHRKNNGEDKQTHNTTLH